MQRNPVPDRAGPLYVVQGRRDRCGPSQALLRAYVVGHALRSVARLVRRLYRSKTWRFQGDSMELRELGSSVQFVINHPLFRFCFEAVCL
jgi:hypothetical protein